MDHLTPFCLVGSILLQHIHLYNLELPTHTSNRHDRHIKLQIRQPRLPRLSNNIRLHPKPRRKHLLRHNLRPLRNLPPNHRPQIQSMDIHDRLNTGFSHGTSRLHRTNSHAPQPLEQQRLRAPNHLSNSCSLLRGCFHLLVPKTHSPMPWPRILQNQTKPVPLDLHRV